MIGGLDYEVSFLSRDGHNYILRWCKTFWYVLECVGAGDL